MFAHVALGYSRRYSWAFFAIGVVVGLWWYSPYIFVVSALPGLTAWQNGRYQQSLLNHHANSCQQSFWSYERNFFISSPPLRIHCSVSIRCLNLFLASAKRVIKGFLIAAQVFASVMTALYQSAASLPKSEENKLYLFEIRRRPEQHLQLRVLDLVRS